MTQHAKDAVQTVSQLLHQAAETHHVVFAISDGEDPDWASWYADRLVNLSALPQLPGRPPVRSQLTWLLVELDREYSGDKPSARWEDVYAERLVQHFANKQMIVLALRPHALPGLSRISSAPGTPASGGQVGQPPRRAIRYKCLDREP